jgi:uncharacterized protein (DUF1330 family)
LELSDRAGGYILVATAEDNLKYKKYKSFFKKVVKKFGGINNRRTFASQSTQTPL